MSDLELDAMADIDKVMAKLPDEPTKQRVLDWVADRHGLSLAKGSRSPRRDGAGAGAGYSDDGVDDGGKAMVGEQEMLEEVARQTGVSVERLEQLVMLEDGDLKMVLTTKDLSQKSNAEATRIIARILTVVGLYGLGRADTPFEMIRAECDRLKVYDSKKFASDHLPSIDGFAVRGDKKRRLEARRPGLKAFPALVDTLLGAE